MCCFSKKELVSVYFCYANREKNHLSRGKIPALITPPPHLSFVDSSHFNRLLKITTTGSLFQYGFVLYYKVKDSLTHKNMLIEFSNFFSLQYNLHTCIRMKFTYIIMCFYIFCSVNELYFCNFAYTGNVSILVECDLPWQIHEIKF